jgi:hypothetical protein
MDHRRVIGGDGRVAGGACLTELDGAVVGDIGGARRARIEEGGRCVVDDAGAARRVRIGELELPVVGDGGAAAGDVDPVPVNVMPPLLIVKLYADVPVKFQAPAVARTEMGILLLVLVAKVAVPVGAVAGVQFAAAL